MIILPAYNISDSITASLCVMTAASTKWLTIFALAIFLLVIRSHKNRSRNKNVVLQLRVYPCIKSINWRDKTHGRQIFTIPNKTVVM